MADDDFVLLDSLPSRAFGESFELRRNGSVLVGRIDEAEILTHNFADPNAEPVLLFDFSTIADTNCIAQIRSLPGADDEYIVLTVLGDWTALTATNKIVWRLVLDPEDRVPPKVTKLMDNLDAIGVILPWGICCPSQKTVLLTDPDKPCIWKLDLLTGKGSEILVDDTMKQVGVENWGLARVRMVAGFLWYNNSSTGTLCRIPLQVSDSPDGDVVKFTGGVEVVSDEVPACNGFDISEDGRTAWMTSTAEGLLYKLDIEPGSGKSSLSVSINNLIRPTACEVIYVNGKPRVHVLVADKVKEEWLGQKASGKWIGFDQIVMTVTTERDD